MSVVTIPIVTLITSSVAFSAIVVPSNYMEANYQLLGWEIYHFPVLLRC